ncbi:prepilin peptidase [Companilactobacillus furfuricola]|uniref:prepilin peptidase n=1 Tax=Companilactobacillus furfuricola TaxID=1462575 RepID=UPI000F7A0E9A|nr:A24 family peptidase [Companilactobacillus furfuricola]
MLLFFNLLMFFLGACIVSFATVFVQDFELGQVFSHKRSSCDHCHIQIPFYYTIPILGYLATFGKCRNCNNLVKFWYPISEILGGAILLCAALYHKDLVWFVPMFLALVILSVSDFQFGYIYSSYYLPFLIPLALHWQYLHPLEGLLVYFLMFVFQSISNAIGIADVELLAIIAVFFGYVYAVYILFLACCLCILLNLFNKKRSFRFIPYLSVATGIIYLIFV